MDSTSNYKTWFIFARLLSFVRPYRGMLFCCCAASIVIAFSDIVMAYLLKSLINTTLDRIYAELLTNVFLVLGVTILGIIAKFLVRFLSERIGICAIRDIRNAVSTHITRLKLSYVVDKHSGDTVSRFVSNTSIVQKFLENELYQFIYQPLIFTGAFTYMLLLNWQILMVNISSMMIVMLITIMLSKPLEKFMYELQRYIGEVNATAQDVIAGISCMKAYNLHGLLWARYGNVVDKTLNKSLEIEKRISLMSSPLIILQILPRTISIIYGGYLTFKGDLIPGELIAYIYLLGYLAEPMIRILNLFSDIKTTVGAATGLFEVLDAPVERVGGINPVSNKAGNAIIQFIDVRFSFDGVITVLDKLNFEVSQGKKVALLGASGSGKSTVFKLLGGFYEPQEGEIRLNGYLMSKLDPAFIRSQFSIVSQDVYLFPVSIAENIAFGKRGATLDEVIEAAKAAHAHDFIMEFPQGYNTLVGERGARLSGGQRQRISIARAVLKDSPIMLLDEATSALDNQSETVVQEALERLVTGRTVLIIAHRLSTIKNVDEIIVLANGRKVEQGTHVQLLQKKGLYTDLYTRQCIAGKYGLENE
jgi:ABC-type multidrug transport system fused ATPase/permease subunit